MSDATARNRAHAMEVAVFTHCTNHPGSRVLVQLDSYAEVVTPAFSRSTLRWMNVACILTLGLAFPLVFALRVLAKPGLHTFVMQPEGWIMHTFSAYDPPLFMSEGDFREDGF